MLTNPEDLDSAIETLTKVMQQVALQSVENKILIYKAMIILIWTYGLELWGCANKSNISIIQSSQSKIL
jgi:hypothetical protein